MDTDSVPAGAPAAKGSGRAVGCAIALLVLVVLTGLGAWALDEFEKGLDGYGQLEQAGASGSVADPLGPGMTARYEDGLRITVGSPHREPDGTYRLTVTYDNGTGEEVPLGGESIGGASPSLEIREGESLDDYSAGYSLTWLNRQECASALAPPLGADETRGVPLHVRPSEEGIPVTVEVEPADDGSREKAYFQLVLDRPDRYSVFP
ncbi:hypothetical protein ACFY3N_33495 [Streptomyces sp. NPDC000348]|uniref:hypothetical protein n=1 Tax=Streptomyces sp. NPDC000348 TaxID=3364538 RepID=UPI00367C6075